MKKTAVDAVAEEYWTSYYADYGKAWVRKIPLRIASAFVARTAAANAPDLHVRVVPLASAVHNGRFLFEGAVEITAAKKVARRLFAAEFTDAGEMTSLVSIPAR